MGSWGGLLLLQGHPLWASHCDTRTHTHAYMHTCTHGFFLPRWRRAGFTEPSVGSKFSEGQRREPHRVTPAARAVAPLSC